MRQTGKPENRVFVRLKPTGLMAKTGTLVLDKSTPAVTCNVIDISRGGACLELPKEMKLPKRFVFVHGGVKKHCHLVWQKNSRFGVGF
jgi:hypothetical protein